MFECHLSVFELSARPRPSAGKNWTRPSSFPFFCLKDVQDEIQAGKFSSLNKLSDLHVSVSNSINGSDNCLLLRQCKAIISANAGLLLTGILGTNFSEIWKKNTAIFITENDVENDVCQMSAILTLSPCTYWLSCFVAGEYSYLSQDIGVSH